MYFLDVLIHVKLDIYRGREKKKASGKQSKEHRQSRHRLRNGIIRNSSCMEITKPIYFYSDKLDDLQKYVKSNLNGAKRANVENYALVIRYRYHEAVV